MKNNLRFCALLATWSAIAFSHPMGNFSISHYSRLDIGREKTALTYVLDFAEIPTFQLLEQWGVKAGDAAKLKGSVTKEANVWLNHLVIGEDDVRLKPALTSVSTNVQEGAGAMPVLRVTLLATIVANEGHLTLHDNNYPDRTGWKQIVIRGSKGVRIVNSTQSAEDLTEGLTKYPADSTAAPPQDLTASVRFASLPEALAGATPKPEAAAAVIEEKVLPAPAKVNKMQAGSFALQQPGAAGTVVTGDYLSRMLHNRELPWGLLLIGICVAFGLGAVHALSPGHGKTIVAAYLVGNRGTAGHAVLLGAIVTFTHTASVFLLGLGVLFLQDYIVPDRIIPWLGAISGLSIVAVGVSLLYGRTKALLPGHTHHHHDASDHHHEHVHSHSHGHEHEHLHAHGEAHAHSHSHEHGHHHHHEHDDAGVHVHSHGGTTHSHMPVGKVTAGSLIALGVSGGLVPCPSALVLMLSAIALGHAAAGLMLLVGFSLGLALVLMAIGLLVIYAKNLLPKQNAAANHPFFRLVPIFSSVVVICLGLGMTAVALGFVSSRFAL